MSLVTIKNSELTVTISSLGAEIQSIRKANGEEKLWQGDPAFWTGRAPILFPIAGGLINDEYKLNGKTYPMPKHGFVRKLEWAVETANETEAVFLMNEKNEGFPFDYELRACFKLDGSKLAVTYRVSNTGSEEFAFGMGAHEAYATPGGLEMYSIVFDAPEKLENYTLEGNFITHEPVVMAENTTVLPLKTEYFAVDALVFPYLKSRGVTLVHRDKGEVIRVEYPEHDVIMFWTKPGADYICIEPWLNAPDFVDSAWDLDKKTGCVKLLPSETCERTHTITVK